MKKLRSRVMKLDEEIKQTKENERALQQKERDVWFCANFPVLWSVHRDWLIVVW